MGTVSALLGFAVFRGRLFRADSSAASCDPGGLVTPAVSVAQMEKNLQQTSPGSLPCAKAPCEVLVPAPSEFGAGWGRSGKVI